MSKISNKTMKSLLDDTGYTAARITKEAEFVKKEFNGNMSLYAAMSGRTIGRVNRRTERERLVIEFDGQVFQVDVMAKIYLGE